METCEPECWIRAIREVAQEDDEVDKIFFLDWFVDILTGRWDDEAKTEANPPQAA